MIPGRTIITRAEPETTDDESQSPLRLRAARSGEMSPFLARYAVAVDGEVRGRTRVTESVPETTDDDGRSQHSSIAGHGRGIARSRGQTPLASGRTIATKVAAETTDDEPRS